MTAQPGISIPIHPQITFGDRLRRLRLDLHMDQRQFGDRTGGDTQTTLDDQCVCAYSRAVTDTTSRPLITRAEVAKRTRVHPSTVDRWARAGILSPIKIGGVVRFDADEVDALLAGKPTAAAS